MVMRIIEIKKNNIQNHAKLFVETFTQEPWLEDWTIETAYSRLFCYQNTPNFIGLSVIKEDKLIGFIFGNIEPYQRSFHFLLKEMCVKVEYQREGIGKKLMLQLDKILKEKEVTSVILLTQKGSSAEKFYLNSGYSVAASMGLYFKKL